MNSVIDIHIQSGVLSTEPPLAKPWLGVMTLQLFMNSLRELCDNSGIAITLRSHDIRRRARREVALLPKTQVKVSTATASVTSALGHKPNAVAIGIT